MPRFSYLARRPNGEEVSAIQSAVDPPSLAAALRADGLTPISISEVGDRTAYRTSKKWRRGGRPKLSDVAPFVRQLSVMLKAGISLVITLDDLSKQMEKLRFAGIVDDLRNRVMGGASLSRAMRAHQRVFPPLICAMVRAGEESGHLEQVTADLASYLESQISLRRQVKGALVYPAFVGVFFLFATAFLFLFLIPQFEGIYAGLGEELPLISRLALGFSAWLRTWFFMIIGVTVGGVLLMRSSARSPRVRERLDKVKIRLPVLGAVMLKIVLVRFLETLATLQRSGVSILMSLDIAKATAGNQVVEEALTRARVEVMRGSYLSRELAKTDIFPPLLVRMVAVGEETGQMEELLSQTASFYREEVNVAIQSATRLIEPVMIILMGIVVAFVVLAVYLPIFKLAEALG